VKERPLFKIETTHHFEILELLYNPFAVNNPKTK